MSSYKHKDLSKGNQAISDKHSERQTPPCFPCFPSAPEAPPESRSNRFYPYFNIEKQLKVFCHNLCIKSPDVLLNLLDELSRARGHGVPRWSLIHSPHPFEALEPRVKLIQNADFKNFRADGRGLLGLLTVSCRAGKLSHTLDGGDGTPRARLLARQMCAMGMMKLMGVKRSDITPPYLVQDKSTRQIERRARIVFDRYIREERLLSSSKGKQKLKRSLPDDCEEFQRTNPSEPVKSEALVETFQVEPFQLVKAEPFPVIKADPFPIIKPEPFEFIKAEPFESVKTEHIIPVFATELTPPEPSSFIKDELPRDENLEDYPKYSFYIN